MSNDESALSTCEIFKIILDRLNSMDARLNAVEEDKRAIRQEIENY